MRRAVRFVVLAACLALLTHVAPAFAQGHPDRINGIGLIDFASKPTFKVGHWAKYHMSAKSDQGVVDDYTVTVLIAGEERWWGEDGFWIETWTETPTSGTQIVATLMSYDVFSDSLALPHMQLYARKVINGVKEDGSLDESIYKRPASTLKTREPIGSQFKLQIDTLGTESITVKKGSFNCTKLRFLQGRGATGARGDSTDYTELRETRTTFMNPAVPITHIVREDIEQAMTRKVWKVGYSKEALPATTIDRTLGSAELVDCGEGLESKIVPERLRMSLAEQRAAAAKHTAPAPAKPPTTRKSATR